MDPMTNNVPFVLSSDGQYQSLVSTYTCWIQYINYNHIKCLQWELNLLPLVYKTKKLKNLRGLG